MIQLKWCWFLKEVVGTDLIIHIWLPLGEYPELTIGSQQKIEDENGYNLANAIIIGRYYNVELRYTMFDLVIAPLSF